MKVTTMVADTHPPEPTGAAATMHEDILTLAEEIRDAVVDDRLLYQHVVELDQLAVHVEAVARRLEDPNEVFDLVDRMRDCTDRAVRALEAGAAGALRTIDDAVLELLRAGSRTLVLAGVRSILTDEQFEPIARCAVLVGELAKGAFGELVAIRQQAAPGRRRHRFEFNPLHAFAPAIAAGAAWAIERVDADEVDRLQLVECLSDAFAALLERGIHGLMTDPMSHVTMRALTSFTLAWFDRTDPDLLDELDQLADRTVAALDGCDIDHSMLEAWVHVGASAGIAHLLLQRACDGTATAVPDTADCTVLLDILDPTRYDELHP